MKIVVLDGYTLNPGDLSWDALRSMGDLCVFDRTPPAEVVARAAGAEVVLTNKTVLTADAIAALPSLRYIGVLATGYNVVDVAACKARDIVVTNVPAYGTYAVAQWTIALLLELAGKISRHAEIAREQWSSAADFCVYEPPLVELAGLTMGLIGVGAIGSQVGKIAAALGMKVVGFTASGNVTGGIRGVTLEALLRESDVVSLHCPLTPQTLGLINRDRLAQMKPTAFLLNTARGPLVDELALADALRTGRLAGAAVDVLSQEPPTSDNPLLHCPNCLVTPHVAWAARAARTRLLETAIDNIRRFLAGSPTNRVT